MEEKKSNLEKLFGLVSSFLTATDDKFQKILDDFIVNQDFGKKEAEDFSKNMKDFYSNSKQKLSSLIDESIKKTLERADIARSSEIKELKEKIHELEKKLAERQ